MSIGIYKGGKVVLDQKIDNKVSFLRVTESGIIMIESWRGENCAIIAENSEEYILAPFYGLITILSNGTTAKGICWYGETELIKDED